MSKFLTKYKLSDKVPVGASRLILPTNQFGDPSVTITLDQLTDAQADKLYARKDGRGQTYLVPVKEKKRKAANSNEPIGIAITENLEAGPEQEEADCGCPK